MRYTCWAQLLLAATLIGCGGGPAPNESPMLSDEEAAKILQEQQSSEGGQPPLPAEEDSP
jgi:hypothetical protein